MIITRHNYKPAYLVFAANGTINLNKKTIGLWMVELPGKGFLSVSNSTFIQFKAKVHLNRNSLTVFSDKNKIQLMMKVRNNIPDAMLTKIDNSQNC